MPGIWVPDPRPEKASPRIPVPIFCPEQAVTIRRLKEHTLLSAILPIAFFPGGERRKQQLPASPWRPCQGSQMLKQTSQHKANPLRCKSWLPAWRIINFVFLSSRLLPSALKSIKAWSPECADHYLARPRDKREHDH